MLLNATIAHSAFPKPLTDVKTNIAFPICDEDLDASSIITHVDGEDITIKIYKTNYHDSPPPVENEKYKKQCVIQ